VARARWTVPWSALGFIERDIGLAKLHDKFVDLFRDKSDLFSIPGVLDICQAGGLVTGRSGRDRSGQIVDLCRVPAFLTHPNRIEGPTVRCGWSCSNHAVFEFTNQNLRQPILVADFAIYANGNPGEVPGPKEWMYGFEDFGDETTFF